MGEFGNKFRKAREKRGISLDDVSNVTKISARMLQAIEDEHFDLLPGGVFNKGFIRAYAKHLGLNDEEAVTDYLACLRQAQIEANQVVEVPRTAPSSAAATQRPSTEVKAPVLKPPPAPKPDVELPDLQLPRLEHVRPPRPLLAEDRDRGIPRRILVLVGVVIILAAILWLRRSHRARAEAAAASSPAPVGATQAVPTAPTPTAPVAPPPAAPAKQKLAAGANAASAERPSSTNSQPPQSSAAAPHPSPAAPPAPAHNVGNANDDVAVGPAEKPTAPAPSKGAASQKAAPSLMLVIRATETSWISITADGRLVSEETLIAPAHYSVNASREIVARIGNAAGVTFLWNGQEIPAQGAESEVKTFVFNASGMRSISPGPNQ